MITWRLAPIFTADMPVPFSLRPHSRTASRTEGSKSAATWPVRAGAAFRSLAAELWRICCLVFQACMETEALRHRRHHFDVRRPSSMREQLEFYIEGQWVKPAVPKTLDVVNPATEEVIGRISLGSAADVDRAVTAARKAFETFSRTSREERVALLERIMGVYQTKLGEIAATISLEM